MNWELLLSGIAIVVSVVALIWQRLESQSRTMWEADQTTRRENFEKGQARQQMEWQRQHEVQRQREREDDLARQLRAKTPDVAITLQYSDREMRGGHRGERLLSKASGYLCTVINRGQIPLFVTRVFLQDESGEIHQPRLAANVDKDRWLSVDVTTTELPATLQPGQSLQVHWMKNSLTDWFRENGKNATRVVAVAQDGMGHEYESPPIDVRA